MEIMFINKAFTDLREYICFFHKIIHGMQLFLNPITPWLGAVGARLLEGF